jgi:hypothetical protein
MNVPGGPMSVPFAAVKRELHEGPPSTISADTAGEEDTGGGGTIGNVAVGPLLNLG